MGELLHIDDGISIEVTGFALPEIDALVLGEAAAGQEALPEALRPDAVVTRPGDSWHLGRHRLLCGSSMERISFERLMGGDRARIALSDMPYNLKIAGNVSGLGKKTHREFLQGSGELGQAEFANFQIQSVGLHSEFCIDGGLVYMFMDWKHGGEMYQAYAANGLSLVNLAIWVKASGAMGAFLRSQHELCFIGKVGTASYRNNVMLGRFGRNRSNCWMYPGMNSFGKDRDELLAMHPTVKNLDMICDAVRDASNRGDIVVDGFLGSGTTLIAAEKTERVCRGIELDPLYVDGIVRRWEKMTGASATLEGDGSTFAEVSERRAAAASERIIPSPPLRTRRLAA